MHSFTGFLILVGPTDRNGQANGQQSFTGFLILSVKNGHYKVLKTTVSTAIFCPAVCDIIDKTSMCGKSIKYVMILPFSALLFYGNKQRTWQHPEELQFRAKKANETFRWKYICTFSVFSGHHAFLVRFPFKTVFPSCFHGCESLTDSTPL